MTFHTFGLLDDCATSKVARTVLISNPKTFLVGSGLPIVKRYVIILKI